MSSIFISIDKQQQEELKGLKIGEKVSVKIDGKIQGVSQNESGGSIDLEIGTLTVGSPKTGDLSSEEMKQGFRKL